MKSLDVNVLRESIGNITKILSGRGIKVTQRGSRAYVSSDHEGVPLSVNLPYIPDNASEDLIDAINGFLDHEVGHLMFTDFNIVKKANDFGKKVAGMHNIVEDTFIERSMAKRFKGSASNLDNVGNFFLKKYTTPMVNEAIENDEFAKLVGVLIVPAIRAWAGQKVFIEYMDDKWPLIEKVTEMIPESVRESIAKVRSSSEALEVSKTIIKCMGDENEGEGDEGEPGEGDSSESDSKSEYKESKPKETKPKETKSEPEEESESEPKSEPEEESEEESEPKSEPEEESESEPKSEPEEESEPKSEPEEESEPKSEPEEESGPEEEPEPGERSDEGSGEGSESGDSEDSSPEPPLTSEEIEEALGGKEFDDVVAETISDITSKEGADAPYLVYTTDFDIVEPFKVDSSYVDSSLKEMDDEVKKMVGPLQKNLERLIVAQKQSRWNPGQRSGRVNPSGLYKLKTGDDRVFRRREHMGETKDVAVSIVVDCSGSMSHGRIEVAMSSAYAMASVLEKIGVTYEVIGFTTGRKDLPHDARLESSKDERRMRRSFSRSEPIYMPVFKDFDERFKVEQKKRFAHAPRAHFLRNNIDGECVEIAALRLLKRKEAGKIMFVFSDGQPSAAGSSSEQANHLKSIVKKYINEGVRILGVGIETRSVENFYPNYVYLDSVDELPNKVMGELAKVMLK